MDYDQLILAGIKFVVAPLFVLNLAHTLYAFLLRGPKKLRKYGEWAVVTGATDGIGKAYAFELAKHGLNVMLLSRTEAKLVEVEQELKAKRPNVQVRHLAVDFGKFDAAARAAVKKAIGDLDVGVCINNVGMSYSFTKFYHELTDEEVDQLTEINVNSTTWMTKIVLGDVDVEGKPTGNGMLARKRGAIVNTSSAAGRQISPLLAQYSGAKGFVVMFSKSLHAELAPKGIDVQVQTPLFVTTKLAKIKKTSITTPSPATYVRSAVAHIGYEDSISPYWSHALQLWLLDLLPARLSTMIVSSMHHAIRKAGMKKEAKKRAESKAD